jgi:hypothetical protein
VEGPHKITVLPPPMITRDANRGISLDTVIIPVSIIYSAISYLKMSLSGLEQLAKLEREFDQNLKANIRGTAYVRISQLSFPNPLRQIDPKIVDKIKRDFGKEGCLVHQQGCSIPAVLNEDEFRICLENLGVSLESFKTNSPNSPPRFELPINAKLPCLHGQHRIRAAAEYLPPEERWWMVDLYGEG